MPKRRSHSKKDSPVGGTRKRKSRRMKDSKKPKKAHRSKKPKKSASKKRSKSRR